MPEYNSEHIREYFVKKMLQLLLVSEKHKTIINVRHYFNK